MSDTSILDANRSGGSNITHVSDPLKGLDLGAMISDANLVEEESWDQTLPSQRNELIRVIPTNRFEEREEEKKEAVVIEIPDDDKARDEYRRRTEYVRYVERMPVDKQIGMLATAVYDLDTAVVGLKKEINVRFDQVDNRMGRVEKMLRQFLDEQRTSVSGKA
ncbi:hypothetical protein K440DRAFT_214062 [Wilcoxina mikolae CBS 423.85]|nr:hypothetical protein K440DRAFT_214062 [Wilcoxina mikolae CBS 423.85]